MESSWLALTAMITTVFFIVCHLIIKFDKKKRQLRLPPGPFDVPIISGLLWLRKPFSEVEPTIRKLHARYGPIVAIPFCSRRVILISGRSLTHEALVQNGAVFADRPLHLATRRIMSCNQQNISSGFYGPTWRLLRRNLASEILNPSRVKSYARARKWVLDILIKNLMESQTTSKANNGVILRVADHFQYAMFCLLVLMCFGDKLDEKQIKQIENVQRNLLLSFWRFNILNIWPSLTKIVLKKRWEEFFQLKKDQEQVFLPLIDARKEIMKISNGHDDYLLAYADTLCDLELPHENRKLNEDEIICLCSEFLSAGTDTTTTALQWIMANIVKYPMIQEKILTEMKGVVGEKEEEVKEEDLQKMPYLKAVILEGLRRHPPSHYLIPHSVTQDAVFDGYMVPKNAIISFLVADIGWDPEVWEDPMEFKPERFLSQGEGGFDITGSRGIKMMPFGAGRRICPGLGLAVLHLEYFVANLVWKFEWDAVEGDNVDLSEKQEFTMVMKNPLKARIFPRVMK